MAKPQSQLVEDYRLELFRKEGFIWEVALAMAREQSIDTHEVRRLRRNGATLGQTLRLVWPFETKLPPGPYDPLQMSEPQHAESPPEVPVEAADGLSA